MLRVCSFVISFLLLSTNLTLHLCYAQFVEFHEDYKKNHIEDEIKYSYHYYIDHAPSNVYINHNEVRHGTRVNGQYDLLEPGGYVRSVHYEVDGNKGFRTVIRSRNAASRTHQLIQLMNRKQATAPLWQTEPVAFVV